MKNNWEKQKPSKQKNFGESWDVEDSKLKKILIKVDNFQNVRLPYFLLNNWDIIIEINGKVSDQDENHKKQLNRLTDQFTVLKKVVTQKNPKTKKQTTKKKKLSRW